MAITKSAKKSHKRSLVLRARNLVFKLAMKKAIKDVKKAVAEKKEAGDVMDLLRVAYSAIDKAKKRNIIHKNNAARKKSRLNNTVKVAYA